MTFISINKQRLARNFKKRARMEPPIRVAKSRNDQKPRYYDGIKIHGPCTLYYWTTQPILGCGARLVIETEAKVTKR